MHLLASAGSIPSWAAVSATETSGFDRITRNSLSLSRLASVLQVRQSVGFNVTDVSFFICSRIGRCEHICQAIVQTGRFPVLENSILSLRLL